MTDIPKENPPRPCGCPGNEVCLHGIPAIIGTCEEFPKTWRDDYLGISREDVENLADAINGQNVSLKDVFVSHVPPSSSSFDFRCICGHWKRNHNETGCTVGIVGDAEKACTCRAFKCRDLYGSDAEFIGEQEPRS